MANYILVIKGVSFPEYEKIREDLIKQYQSRGAEAPILAWLPQDYPEIEIVWIDEEMEKENFAKSLEVSRRQETSPQPTPKSSFSPMGIITEPEMDTETVKRAYARARSTNS